MIRLRWAAMVVLFASVIGFLWPLEFLAGMLGVALFLWVRKVWRVYFWALSRPRGR